MFLHYLFIYVGRPKEKINLYFALFVFFVIIFVFFISELFLQFFIIDSQAIIDKSKSIASAVCSLAFVYFGTKSLLEMFQYDKSQKLFRIIYILHFVLSLFVITSVLSVNHDVYKKYFFNVSIFISLILMLTSFITLGKWILVESRQKNESFLFVFAGVIFVVINLFIGRILSFYNIIEPYYDNFLLVALGFYTFAYFLAYRINKEHNELLEKKIELEDLTANLEKKVAERTLELKDANDEIENIIKQKTYFFINLAHETKTPLTLISNYLDKYIKKIGVEDSDLKIIKQNIEKLLSDMLNFFDIEKIQRGDISYNNDLITNFSEILNEKIILFKEIALQKKIKIESDIEDSLFIKA
ncbi:MAG TPA: 7TM diverse intracellular signaling domain-containing protein, partial [Spirochaetota bacterium]|nr:7TM diverse intracellular signaling domain-containing protein [Spirochaetota bacterium]